MKPVDGLLLDFDGTLAPHVPEVGIRVLHDLVCRWKPVPEAFVRQYFRAVTALPMGKSLGLFLESLGLADRLAEVGAALATAGEHGDLTVGLDPHVLGFLRSRPRGRVKVFSSAGSRADRFAPLLEVLGPGDFLDYPGFPKADPGTWGLVARDLGIDPGRWVCVDDTPLALWAAKTAGFLTVMRTNSVFTDRDADSYSPWIDHRVGSIAELARRFRPQEVGHGFFP